MNIHYIIVHYFIKCRYFMVQGDVEERTSPGLVSLSDPSFLDCTKELHKVSPFIHPEKYFIPRVNYRVINIIL